jgi:hypothetical protein
MSTQDDKPKDGEYRIVRHRVPMFGIQHQPCIWRDHYGQWIPVGPLGDDVDEVRSRLQAMLAACDRPVLNEEEAESNQ